MTSNKIVTLTTDFGLQDPFVGTMKGVILNIEPSAKLIDITHQIAPQDLLQSFYILRSAFGYFPPGTVDLWVTNPQIISTPGPEVSENRVIGEIIYSDRFGNLVTNISSEYAKSRKNGATKDLSSFEIAGITGKIVTNYTQGSSDQLCAIVNSWDLLEMFLFKGNAKVKYKLNKGDRILFY